MSHSPSVTRTLFTATEDKVITNTTTETSAVPVGQGSLTLPANFWKEGTLVKITGSGTYQTPVVPGGVTIRLKLGSTTLASVTVSASALSTSSTTRRFNATFIVTCQSEGVSGSVMVDGSIAFTTSATARIEVDLNNSGNSTTVDTTASGLLDITTQWGNAQSGQGTTTTTLVVTKEKI